MSKELSEMNYLEVMQFGIQTIISNNKKHLSDIEALKVQTDALIVECEEILRFVNPVLESSDNVILKDALKFIQVEYSDKLKLLHEEQNQRVNWLEKFSKNNPPFEKALAEFEERHLPRKVELI